MSGSAIDRAATWFDDACLVSQMPPVFRWYARYSRSHADPSTGFVRGGGFLLRLITRIVQARGRGETLRLRIGERVVFCDAGDPRALWVPSEVQGDNAEARVLAHCLSAGDTFIDVGANHGSYALLAAEIVGGSGRVVAIEPNPRLAPLVRRTLAQSDTAPFLVLQTACGAAAEDSTMFIPRAGSGSGGLHAAFSASAAHRALSVPVRTLDQLLKDVGLPGRVVMKIDVEGSERAMLVGAREFLAAKRPVLLIEINPASAQASGSSAGELVATLGELGYLGFAELDRPNIVIPATELDLTVQRNVLARQVLHDPPVIRLTPACTDSADQQRHDPSRSARPSDERRG